MTHLLEPDDAAIAERAYEIYLARDGREGLAEEDWYQAKAELIQAGIVASDAGPNVPLRSGGRAEKASEVMPDVASVAEGQRPEVLTPPGSGAT